MDDYFDIILIMFHLTAQEWPRIFHFIRETRTDMSFIGAENTPKVVDYFMRRNMLVHDECGSNYVGSRAH